MPAIDAFLSPDQPARAVERTDADRLDSIERLLFQLVQLQTPGVKGIEGAESPPELQFDAVIVRAGATRPIPANHKRKVICFYNIGPETVYVTDEYVTDTSKGMPIPVGAERALEVTNTLYLTCGSDSTGVADVRIAEEST